MFMYTDIYMYMYTYLSSTLVGETDTDSVRARMCVKKNR